MKITIITVAYNSASTIADTINSVKNQSYIDYEHLIIDGLSTDSTVGEVKKLHHSKMTLISERDEGIYDAMNKGLEIASGDVIGFLNSDDFYQDSDVLSRIANTFSDSTIDACYADLLYISQDKKNVIRYWKSKKFISGEFANGWCPAHPTFYVRKSRIDELGGFDLSYRLAADVEFMMRYLECGHLNSIYIPEVLVSMRVGGVTNQSWGNIIKQNREIISALRKNNIPFSRVRFFVNKVINRLWQFVEPRLN